jgi:hypothetical protein
MMCTRTAADTAVFLATVSHTVPPSMQCMLMNSERCRSVLAHAMCMHCIKLVHVYLAHISRAVITLFNNCS